MSQVYALVLTDIVDSTAIAAVIGDESMKAHGNAHDKIARSLLQKWQGYEVEMTDGVLAVFADIANAANFALSYHRALLESGSPFKARAGIHFGNVTLRENDSQDIATGARAIQAKGIAVNVVARVMNLAMGGQTLLTSEARDELQESDWHIRSHGHWRLKGLPEPIDLFEISEPGSTLSPPVDELKAYRVTRRGDDWIPAREIAHSLPTERDSFVGRQDTLREIATKYELNARLLNVVGTGGTGKTRVATHFARLWLGDFPGGAWFCDLSQARSLDGVLSALAEGLNVPLGTKDPVTQLAHAIHARGRCILILDNFEQVALHAEATLGYWLDRAPDACFLVTSREVLGIKGEQILILPPLPLGDAVSLFISRAKCARQDFEPSPKELLVIAELAKVLDGLPLAIELAAARIRVLTPAALLTSMRKRFGMLVSRRGRLGRHATLRATFDWSWSLLDNTERTALAQLSVFEGGFTLESAQSILRLFADCNVIDIVQSLVDKSLVRRVNDNRFDLLVSLREYCAEHLRTEGRFHDSGPRFAADTERRHYGFYSKIGSRRVIEDSCVELDNLAVACHRAVAHSDADAAAATLLGAWTAIKLRGPFRAGVDLCVLVKSIALPSRAFAMVNRIHGCALMLIGKMAEARDQLETSVQQAKTISDALITTHGVANLSELAMREGRITDALELASSVLSGSDALDPTLECSTLSAIGTCHEYLGRLDLARHHYERTLDRARELGERRWEGGALGNLGQLAANAGMVDEAHRYYESALAIADELGDRQWEGNVRCNLGLLCHEEGKHQDAERYLEAALSVARELGHRRLEGVTLCNLGIVRDALGRRDEARECLVTALNVARDLSDRRSEGQFLGYLGLLRAREHNFAEAEAHLEMGATLLRAVNDRASLGVLLCAKVEAAHLAGNASRAGALLQEVQSISATIHAEPRSELGIALYRVASLIQH